MGRASINHPKNLARKLAAIRGSLGLSQNEMIRELDLTGKLTQSEVSAFELGKRIPPLIVLLRYARAFNVHVDDLIDDEMDLEDSAT